MARVKIWEIQALGIYLCTSQVDAGLKKSKMADIYCIIPQFLDYKGLKSTNSVRIRFNQVEKIQI